MCFFLEKNCVKFQASAFLPTLVAPGPVGKMPAKPARINRQDRGKIGQDPYGKMALALAGHNTSTSSHKVITSGRTR